MTFYPLPMHASNAPQVVEAPAAQGVPVVVKPGVDAAQAVYRAFNAQRQELAGQLDHLEDKRRGMTNQLREQSTGGADKIGIEQRIAEIDKRIADVDKQLAAADQAVAKAAAIPGAVQQPPERRERDGPPEEVYVLGGMFIVAAVLFPLSVALARRIWRRGAAAAIAFPQELAERLTRVDQAIDSIAIEVERIGEGQRFVTRVMSENGRAPSAIAAAPVHGGVLAERVKVPRESERGER